MAAKYLSATAAWSAAVWWTTAGGTTTTTAPGVGDDADLNTRTLTIDQDVTCDNIVGTTGTLAVSGNRTTNANIGSATSGFGCTLSGANQTVTVNGNIVGGVTTSRIFITGATTTLTGAGSITGGVGASIRGVSMSGGTLAWVGDVVGGASAAYGVRVSSGSPVINITGNVTGGTAGEGLNLNGTPAVTVTGNVAGGSGGAGIRTLTTGGSLAVTGSLTDASGWNAISRESATSPLTYTPASNHTATIGGKVMYPTSGGPISPLASPLIRPARS